MHLCISTRGYVHPSVYWSKSVGPFAFFSEAITGESSWKCMENKIPMIRLAFHWLLIPSGSFYSIFIDQFISQNCFCPFIFFNFPQFIFPSITHHLPLLVFVFLQCFFLDLYFQNFFYLLF